MVAGTQPATVRSDTLAGRVLEGQGHLRYLATSEGLRDASARIAQAAFDMGCMNIMAASPQAGGALAATALLSPELRQVDVSEIRSCQADKVLLVETVAVSGMRVQKAIARVLEAGASWVGVVVLFPVAASGAADLVDALGLHSADAVYAA